MTDEEKDEDNDDTYDVGYGKPPKHSQFKKGNTFGKGRRKGSKNLTTIVREAFEAKVAIRSRGSIRNVSKIELAAHQLANKASGGDMKAIALSLDLYGRHGPLDVEGTISDDEAAYDLDTLRHHLAMKGEVDDE